MTLFMLGAAAACYACRNLLHKNSATETLIELRSARIAALAAVLISRGLTMPAATTIAAADASAVDRDLEAQAKSQAGKAAATQLSELCSYEGLLQRNQALMRKSRAQGMQIQAMESALQRAGVPLPPRTLDSSSLSSCASASFSSTGTFSDEEVPAAGPAARVGVVAAACVTAQPQVGCALRAWRGVVGACKHALLGTCCRLRTVL